MELEQRRLDAIFSPSHGEGSQVGKYRRFLACKVRGKNSGKHHLATRYLAKDRPRAVELIKSQLEVDLCARIYGEHTSFGEILVGGPCPHCRELGARVLNTAEHYLSECPKHSAVRQQLLQLGAEELGRGDIVALWEKEDIYSYISATLLGGTVGDRKGDELHSVEKDEWCEESKNDPRSSVSVHEDLLIS